MNNLIKPKIVKVEQVCGDNTFIQVSDEINKILLFKPQPKDKLIIFFDNGEKLRISYESLIRALKNEAKDLYEKHKNLHLFMNICEKDEDFVKDFTQVYNENLQFSELKNLEDITDELFNNFERINRSTLISQGLWAGNGIRQIEIDYDADEFLHISEKGGKKLYLMINKMDNDEIEPIIFKIKNNIIYFDTDKFVDLIDEGKNEANFYGYIVAGISKDNNDFYQYCKFEIKIINPLSVVKDKEVVSIDFGTSSTCVSVNRGKELIAFTDNPEIIEDFENQTAMIIFNWQKIYKEWRHNNKTIPHFNRSKNSVDKVDIEKEHYNYSNYIKEELKEAPKTKTVEAIISDIKSLPLKLFEDRENKESIKPFDNFKNKVYLTDDISEENSETLNPIALYSYLMGRCINLQIKNSPYIRYTLTMPVKFNKEQREVLRSSIEYGLKRSLPIALKDKISVKIGFDEPVALIGSAKKLKYFRFKEYDKDAFLYAVFDFGGGTLDFAFGLFRKYSKDERKAILKKESQYKDIIEVFKTDGMRLGGEKLIEKLSYFIYKENKERMKEQNIPIFIPEGEEKIVPYPEHLFGNRHIDRLNLRNINERISRRFFINGELDISTVNLFSINDEHNEKEITLDLPTEKMEEFLNEEVLKAVENFKEVLINVFKEYKDRIAMFGFEDFDINEVRIFQAGNTCKSKWVKNAFNQVFKDHPHIILLEDSEAKDEFKKITVKNAVAKGALFLEGSGYYNFTKNENGLMPLDRYVWNYEKIEEEGEDAEPALMSGDTEKKEFVFIGVLNDDNSFTIFYSFKRVLEDEDDEDLKYHSIEIPEELVDEDNRFVYAKPYDGKVIELAFGDDRECDGTKLYGCLFINLDTGNIEVKNEE